MNDNDWTAPLIDRVNEFLREHPVTFEVDNGADCARAIAMLHGYCGSLKCENERLRTTIAIIPDEIIDRPVPHTVTEATMRELLVEPQETMKATMKAFNERNEKFWQKYKL